MRSLAWELAVIILLAAFFVLGGVVNLAGPRKVVEDFVRWGYPAWFHLVTGILELAVAALLVFPATRGIGASLGFGVMLVAAATLIFHREYVHAIPALVVLGLIALVAWL